MEPLVAIFESQTGNELAVSYASTGKHYAQIVNGAPFDIFLAADAHTTRLLEESGRAVTGSRFTYARGRLVLWGKAVDLSKGGVEWLQRGEFRFLAIANPQAAPYGKAAEQALRNLGLWDSLKGRLVRGENVAQAFAFVSTGNAQSGLLALSQVKQIKELDTNLVWLVPQELHEPINQQAVLITNKQAAQEFVDFLRSQEARQIIVSNGYLVP